MKRLSGKVAVITGGNSGIGKSIAQKYYEEGAKVVVFGRNKEKLQEVKSEISSDILTVSGDVTNTADLKNLFEKTNDHFGKINILVANAGVGRPKKI